MSKNKTTRAGTWTSAEAATSANPCNDVQLSEDHQLETYCELPSSLCIPLPEPASPLLPAAKPHLGPSDLEIAEKRELSVGDRRTGGGRATRKSTRAAQAGTPEPVYTTGAVDAAASHGGRRVGNDALRPETGALVDGGDPVPLEGGVSERTAPSLDEPQRELAVTLLKSPVEKRTPSVVLTPGLSVEPRTPCAALTPELSVESWAFGGSQTPELPVESWACGGSQTPGHLAAAAEDNVLATPDVLRPARRPECEPAARCTVVTAKGYIVIDTPTVVNRVTNSLPSRFDLCDERDQQGPLPVEDHGSERLTGVEECISPYEEHDLDSLDDERVVERALHQKGERRYDDVLCVGAMAIIVEEPEGKYRRRSTKHKAKNTPHEGGAREFSRTAYVEGNAPRRALGQTSSNTTGGHAATRRRRRNRKSGTTARQRKPFGGSKRKASLKPDDGARGSPDGPTDSSSSDGYSSDSSASSESSESSSSEVYLPPKWDGTPDIHEFESWVFEVETWQKISEFSDEVALLLATRFLAGEALSFFMYYVAADLKEWTMERLFDSLFHYCFPGHCKTHLRGILERTKQGQRGVRNFVREIQKLASRLGNVSDFALAQIFWYGLNTDLRFDLMRRRLDPKTTALDELVKYAEEKERALSDAKLMGRQFEGSVPDVHWDRFRAAWRYGVPNPRTQTHQEAAPAGAGPLGGGKAPKGTGPPRANDQAAQKGKMSQGRKKEFAQRRAEGRCFTCGDKGHKSRNCSARHA